MCDTELPQRDSPPPMIKEETVKDDGRTLIYYTFPEERAAPAPPSPSVEAAHV
jgi:hypothetical protein